MGDILTQANGVNNEINDSIQLQGPAIVHALSWFTGTLDQNGAMVNVISAFCSMTKCLL